MLKSYPAIFHKEDDGSFWVEFPGFGGGTEGDDVEEAMKNAREMLESSLAAYLDEGLELPKVVNMSELSVEDGFITLIQAPIFKKYQSHSKKCYGSRMVSQISRP
ncbi:Predicted nuclease of the RNAse H fold, HicB family [Streptococcus gallolyticus]|uniref:Predicted nuclease of the RNAse H fold, HicB family n=1 Tax=Streptococcus gallolyticus TaxID=315405 RepID=A0A1I7JP56_9STRE|nr:Predicted nuclease of the RNAse H fold, HicB family [Streptococcus gallolyticus]